MNKLDELFKEKLNDHSLTPSAGSWDKVEAGLSKKNKAIVWLRWAAVFLFATLTLGLFLKKEGDTPLPVAKENQQPVLKDENKVERSSTIIAEKKTERKSVRPNKNKVKSHQAIQSPVVKDQKEETAQAIEETNEVIAVDPKETVAVNIEPVATPVDKARSIVLVYTLEAIEPAHTVEHNDFVTAEKKDTSIKRVMKFAKDVKNGDAPLGGLRVMKEDLFALELKKKTPSKKQ